MRILESAGMRKTADQSSVAGTVWKDWSDGRIQRISSKYRLRKNFRYIFLYSRQLFTPKTLTPFLLLSVMQGQSLDVGFAP